MIARTARTHRKGLNGNRPWATRSIRGERFTYVMGSSTPRSCRSLIMRGGALDRTRTCMRTCVLRVRSAVANPFHPRVHKNLVDARDIETLTFCMSRRRSSAELRASKLGAPARFERAASFLGGKRSVRSELRGRDVVSWLATSVVAGVASSHAVLSRGRNSLEPYLAPPSWAQESW